LLSTDARDGAARTGQTLIGERKLEFPSILWIESELRPTESHFEPTLTNERSPKAAIVSTTSFTAPAPEPAGGQLVFERELLAMPSMSQGRVRLHDLAGTVAVFHGAYSLQKNPKRLAPMLAKARREAGFARLLYAPGLGEPAHLALLAYAGVDLFDSVALSFAAAQGQYLTTDGTFRASELKAPLCSCPACHGEAPERFTEEELRRHNQYAALNELGMVRNAIRLGRLRELVEARVRAHPELTALLRRVDADASFIEERAPITRRQKMFANTKESLRRVEVARFRERVLERYRPDATAPVLVLFPCSHRKPYSRSRTHRSFSQAIFDANAAGIVHEVIVTSPLGIVPRELETTYPAAHYDVPVTGEWDEEEGRMIRELLASLLSKRQYPHVVSHLPKHTYDLVKELLPASTIVTCMGEDATKPVEITRLRNALGELTKTVRRPMNQKFTELLQGLASYQFGPKAAELLLAGTNAHGRWPIVKLQAGKLQLGMLPPDRGLLSLTMDGARRILPAGVYQVEIEDFPITGSIFAVGVKHADAQIRVGDEVIVVCKNDVRAVGVATMTGAEMVEMKRGEAVKVRHHA
jgi:archaeosine synthase alpha-subunit